MKTILKMMFLSILLLSIRNEVKAQFTYLKIDAKLGDTTGGVKCMPPYEQGINIYIKVFGFSGSALNDSMLYYFDWGDGHTWSQKKLLSRTSASLGYATPIGTFLYFYKTTGTYKAKIAVTSLSTGATDTVFLPSVTFGDSCTTFVGKLYNDANKNCVADPGELGLNWVPIRAINTTTGDTTIAEDWTDTAGNYSFKMPAGNYILTPLIEGISSSSSVPKDTISPFCPSSGSTTISVLPLSTYNSDFGYECKPNDTFDAAINILSNGFVTGDTSVMFIQSGNISSRTGCIGRDATITVTLDPALDYAGVYSGYTPTVSGKVLTYTLVDADISNFKSMLLIATATTSKIGDTLCTTANITPATGYHDPNLTNNFINYCKAVASSFDPNIKEVSPKGIGNEGYISNNTALSYNIHFQNTGTAFARNVIIVDTLENDLDASSLRILSSSHNMTVKKLGSIVTFEFKNIFLPDSATNYFGSMGFVSFGILLKKGLTPGTEIRNRAGIYFDFNDPIITNYTLNTIEIPSKTQYTTLDSLSFSVYPNPSNKELNIKSEHNATFTVSLMDLLGRTMVAQKTENGHLVITTENLSSGIYLVNIKSNKGQTINTKVHIQH